MGGLEEKSKAISRKASGTSRGWGKKEWKLEPQRAPWKKGAAAGMDAAHPPQRHASRLRGKASRRTQQSEGQEPGYRGTARQLTSRANANVQMWRRKPLKRISPDLKMAAQRHLTNRVRLKRRYLPQISTSVLSCSCKIPDTQCCCDSNAGMNKDNAAPTSDQANKRPTKASRVKEGIKP